MKKYLAVVLLQFTLNILIAQTEKELKLGKTSLGFEKYDMDVSVLRSHIYDGLPKSYREGKYERMTFRFADAQAISISNLLLEGETYREWKGFEDYLNQILEKVIPEELKNDKGVHAYIVKDGYYNAFMTASGSTFFNVGLFGYVHDEATIAAVMAHELAHYYKRHSLKAFVKQEKGKFNDSVFRNGRKKEQEFSVKMELQSDSLAMEWLHRSGYHIKGLLNTFRMMERIEKQMIRRSPNKNELKKTTHPLSDERLENFTHFFEKYKHEPGEMFLVSEPAFKMFKEECKPKILEAHLHSFEYDDCLEKAFKFHLKDPDNPIYVYYLMESLRRKCYLNSEKWNDIFFTSRYYENAVGSMKNPKPKLKANLFEKFNIDILAMGPKDLNQIKARFYWEGSPKFITNEHAFEFFYKLGDALNCSECYLSNALSQVDNKKQRDTFLKKYLEQDDVNFKQFAIDLLSGEVRKKLSFNKLLIYNDLDGYIRQGNEKIPIRFHNLKDTKILNELFDSVGTSFPKRELLYFNNLKYSDIEHYCVLKELENFSFYRTIAKGYKTKLHILDPRYIAVFYRYDINEVEFVNYSYTEHRKGEGKLEDYKEAMNMNYSDLFNQKNRTRFLEVYISSLREIDNSPMKTRYYGGVETLKFRKRCFETIVFELKNKIHLKQKKFN